MHINLNLEEIPVTTYVQFLDVTNTIFEIRAEVEAERDTLVHALLNPASTIEGIEIHNEDTVKVINATDGIFTFVFPLGAKTLEIILPFDDIESEYSLQLEIEEVEIEEGEMVSTPCPKLTTNKPYPQRYIHHPTSIFTRWSRAEKAAIGIYEVEQEPVPEGMQVTGWTYEIVGDYATATPTLEPIPEPEPYVPQVISFAQGKRALIRRGYWQAANDFVDSIEDETERLLAQSALHDPQEFHRASPFLNYLAGVLEIPDSEIDEMFIEGAADII